MRDRGTFNFSGNLEVKKDAPLEARSLVNSYADLVKPETWTDEQGGIWKYDCMLVSCKDRPGKVYQLSPGADYTKESSWILIGDTSELNNKVQEFIDSKGAPNGLASLNESGIIPSAQLPSYVDDVIEVDTFSNLPGTGESGKIYIVQDTNLTYRWSGTAYVEISKSLALGETSSTAYPGDKGKATTDKLNRIPDKLITDTVNVNQSTTEAVLNFTTYRQEAQQVGRNTLIITSATTSKAGLMSSSDKTKLDGLKDQAGITSDIDAVQTNLETHINNKSNPHEVTKAQVGLGNVDNTADTDKPISTATQTALDAKFSLTEGNSLKTTADSLPDRIIAYIPGSESIKNPSSFGFTLNTQYVNKSNGVYGSLKQSTMTYTIPAATTTDAGVLAAADKVKIDKITTTGDGTRYLADNGTYKLIQGGGSGDSSTYVVNNSTWEEVLRNNKSINGTDVQALVNKLFGSYSEFLSLLQGVNDNVYIGLKFTDWMYDDANGYGVGSSYTASNLYAKHNTAEGEFNCNFTYFYKNALKCCIINVNEASNHNYDKLIIQDIVTSDNLTTITKKTAAEYEALGSKYANTVYCVTD